MAKLNYRNGFTSVILRVKIMDSTSTTGGAKTGLTSSSSGLIISTIADNEATPTVYAQASSNIETITTLGTFAAPTASKCRFKEVDATNHPGLYEVQIADARWAVSNARSVIVSLSGVTGMAQVDAEVQLEPVPSDLRTVETTDATDYFDGIRRMLSRFKACTWIDTTDSAKTIIEAASAGTLCILGPGTHALGGNSITVPANVSVVGCGRDVTVVTSTLTAAVIWRLGNNTLTEGFTIQSLNTTDGVFDYPLGLSSGSFSNARVRHMKLIGRSDGVYITTTSACSGEFEDIIIQTEYDGWLSHNVSTPPAHYFVVRDVRIDLVETNETNTIQGANFGGSTSAQYIVNNLQVSLTAPPSGSTDQMIGVRNGSGARVVMSNSVITLYGTAASVNQAILVTTSGGNGSIVAVNCQFDRSKVSAATAGSFIDRQELAYDSIKASTYDESTAFPIGSADSGSTQLFRKGSGTVDATTLLSMLTGLCPISGTIGATGNDTTHLHLTGLTYADSDLADWILIFNDVSTSKYYFSRIITWVNSTALATLQDAVPTPENSVDKYWLIPPHITRLDISESVFEVDPADHDDVAGTFGQRITGAATTTELVAEIRADLESGTPIPVDVALLASDPDAPTRLATSANTMITGIVNDANFTPTSTQFRLVGPAATPADAYKNRRVLVTSGTLNRQVSAITASSLISGETHLTISPALTAAPADGVAMIIV